MTAANLEAGRQHQLREDSRDSDLLMTLPAVGIRFGPGHDLDDSDDPFQVAQRRLEIPGIAELDDASMMELEARAAALSATDEWDCSTGLFAGSDTEGSFALPKQPSAALIFLHAAGDCGSGMQAWLAHASSDGGGESSPPPFPPMATTTTTTGGGGDGVSPALMLEDFEERMAKLGVAVIFPNAPEDESKKTQPFTPHGVGGGRGQGGGGNLSQVKGGGRNSSAKMATAMASKTWFDRTEVSWAAKDEVLLVDGDDGDDADDGNKLRGKGGAGPQLNKPLSSSVIVEKNNRSRHSNKQQQQQQQQSMDGGRSSVASVEAAVQQARKRWGVPRRRVFVGGFGLGGAMALHFACMGRQQQRQWQGQGQQATTGAKEEGSHHYRRRQCERSSQTFRTGKQQQQPLGGVFVMSNYVPAGSDVWKEALGVEWKRRPSRLPDAILESSDDDDDDEEDEESDEEPEAGEEEEEYDKEKEEMQENDGAGLNIKAVATTAPSSFSSSSELALVSESLVASNDGIDDDGGGGGGGQQVGDFWISPEERAADEAQAKAAHEAERAAVKAKRKAEAKAAARASRIRALEDAKADEEVAALFDAFMWEVMPVVQQDDSSVFLSPSLSRTSPRGGEKKDEHNEEATMEKKTTTTVGLPCDVFVSHGEDDQIVPLSWAHSTAQGLLLAANIQSSSSSSSSPSSQSSSSSFSSSPPPSAGRRKRVTWVSHSGVDHEPSYEAVECLVEWVESTLNFLEDDVDDDDDDEDDEDEVDEDDEEEDEENAGEVERLKEKGGDSGKKDIGGSLFGDDVNDADDGQLWRRASTANSSSFTATTARGLSGDDDFGSSANADASSSSSSSFSSLSYSFPLRSQSAPTSTFHLSDSTSDPPPPLPPSGGVGERKQEAKDEGAGGPVKKKKNAPPAGVPRPPPPSAAEREAAVVVAAARAAARRDGDDIYEFDNDDADSDDDSGRSSDLSNTRRRRRSGGGAGAGRTSYLVGSGDPSSLPFTLTAVDDEKERPRSSSSSGGGGNNSSYRHRSSRSSGSSAGLSDGVVHRAMFSVPNGWEAALCRHPVTCRGGSFELTEVEGRAGVLSCDFLSTDPQGTAKAIQARLKQRLEDPAPAEAEDCCVM